MQFNPGIVAPQITQQGGGQSYDPRAEYERQSALADALLSQSQNYIPNSGGLGAIAQIANAFAGKHLANKASGSLSEALQQQGLADERSLQAQFDHENRLSDLKHDRDLEKIDRQKVEKDERTIDQKNADAAGLSLLDYQKQKAAFSRSPGVTVNTGESSTPFDKELAKKDAERYATIVDAADKAASSIATLDQLDKINALEQGGRVGEAQAIIGELFGTDASVNRQVFNASSNKLVLGLTQQLSGALSEGELSFLKQAAPSFGANPQATKRIIDTLRTAAERDIQVGREVSEFATQNGSLRGFQPSIKRTYGQRSNQGGAEPISAQPAPEGQVQNPKDLNSLLDVYAPTSG